MNSMSKLIAFSLVLSASSVAMAASDTTPPTGQMPMQGQMKAQMQQNMQQHMKAVDTNGDGNISREEFMASCEKRFAKMDSNGDGQITPDEHQQMKAKWMQQHKGQMGGQSAPQ